jgi:hypothetical protein
MAALSLNTNAKRYGLGLFLILFLHACGLLPKDHGQAKAPPPIVASGPSSGQAGSPSAHGNAGRPETRPEVRSETRPETRQDARPTEPARPSAGAKAPPAPIADQKIDLAGSCSQTEEDGYREHATLTVRNNQVQSMAWQLWVGKKGTCKFDFADFAQTKTRPSIELNARDGSGCKLVIYQDPRRVTLGFADCQKRCTGSIYDEAYPVMFDPKTGSCANLSH